MENYYNKKLLQAICFADDVRIYLDENVLKSSFLEMVNHFLSDCNMGGIANERMRENLIELTDYLRYNGKLDLANDFIRLINRADINIFSWANFITEEVDKRINHQKIKFNIFDDKFIEELSYSLALDYLVLQSLLCDDETFQNEFVSRLMLDEFYFVSYKRISEEFPKLFEDKKTCERMVTIHLCNKMMKKMIKKQKDITQKENYRSILKTGNKLIKRMIK